MARIGFVVTFVSTWAFASAVACGGSEHTGTPSSAGGVPSSGGSSGTSASGGASGTSGGATATNGGASGTSGGATAANGGAGTGGASSLGNVAVDFTVEGTTSYCRTAMCDGPPIDIKDVNGNSLVLETGCGNVDCSSCEGEACTDLFCPPTGVKVTRATLDWDGTFYAAAKCGGSRACTERALAQPGKYTATFCATPGRLTGPDGGFSDVCVPSGPATCSTVEFQFPDATTVAGTLGP